MCYVRLAINCNDVFDGNMWSVLHAFEGRELHRVQG